MMQRQLAARSWRTFAIAAAVASLQCARPPALRETVRAPDEPAVAFVGVTVLPLDTAAVLADHTVIVRGDRIERLGPRAAIAVPPGAQVIDGRGRYLIPGLMDMHVHLARRQSLELLVAFGVTTVRNMWGAPIDLAWRDRIARGELPGPRIFTAGPIVDGDPPVHPGSLIVRTVADADAAIALHRRLGYDFVKIYSRLSLEAFDRLIEDARRDGLRVVGHVPRAVPLAHAVDAGMASIEHMTGFVAALQAADSPVAGRTDGPSRARQIDHVDETRLPALARQLAAHGTFAVPTRSVMDHDGSAAEVRARLAAPELRWLPPCERALAEPGPDDADDLDRSRRGIALYDRALRALDQAGAPIAAGTDLQNPLQVPGATLHRELELLVGAGLSPLAALQAATRRGAELVGRPGELGRIEPGMRADLVLLDRSPLDDIRNTRQIAGVMARGRYHGRAELDAALARIAADFAGPQDPFRGAPALEIDGEPVFRAAYDVTWRGVAFGSERVAVGRRGAALEVGIESVDLHDGETTRVRWRSGESGDGAALTLELDGQIGRGRVDVERDAGELHARGTSLPGIAVAADRAIAAGSLLAPAALPSAAVLWRSRIVGLAAGQSIDLAELEVGVGSELDVGERALRIRRVEDRDRDRDAGGHARVRVYEVVAPGRPRSELVTDAEGWPLEITMLDHGSVLRVVRRP